MAVAIPAAAAPEYSSLPINFSVPSLWRKSHASHDVPGRCGVSITRRGIEDGENACLDAVDEPVAHARVLPHRAEELHIGRYLGRQRVEHTPR